MNLYETKRLKEIVIYKGLHFFKEDIQVLNNLEKMGFITIEKNLARPTQKGIDKAYEMRLLK